MSDIVKRHMYADYLNTNTAEEPEYYLCGMGFVTLDESPGSQVESVQYVCDKSASSEVISYETQFPFEAEQIVSEEAINKIYTVARNHLTGSDAETDYVREELWDPAEGEHTYKARKFTVSIEVSDIKADSGKMSLSGNLNAVGDPVFGSFSTAMKEFTPDSDEPEPEPEPDTDPTVHPATEGWYEKSQDLSTCTLSEDTDAVIGKTYFEMDEWDGGTFDPGFMYVDAGDDTYTLSEDETAQVDTTYYVATETWPLDD